MALPFEVLGAPGGDNALWVRADSGRGITRLLFDAGDCLRGLGRREIQAVDGLFFSHLHLDHVAGFDHFFRHLYDRNTKVNQIFGPPGTARIIQHRLRGFLWNLACELQGTWWVHNVFPHHLETFRFELSEAFGAAHFEGRRDHGGTLWSTDHLRVEAITLDHKTPCLGYCVREAARWVVDGEALTDAGLPPGPWLARLKAPLSAAAGETVVVAGQRHSLEDLRRRLLRVVPGEAVAYTTDFRLDQATAARLVPWLAGCATLVCESQYACEDAHLAAQHYHLTACQAAELARDAGVGQLVLFHLSDRYDAPRRREMLAAARAVYHNCHYPDPSWET